MTEHTQTTADSAVEVSHAPDSRTPSLMARFKDPKRWKKSLRDLALWFIYGIILTTLLSRYSPGHPIVVGTSSIQPGVYWLDKTAHSYYLGVYVSFPFKPAQEWLRARYGEDRIFAKQVKGVAGDTVSSDDKGMVRVCHNNAYLGTSECEDLGLVVTVDSVGRLMTPWIPANHQYTLREGELWVYGTNKRSLDSRYYGPIRTDIVTGQAKPMLLWSE